MKSTDNFRTTIKSHLDQVAKEDKLFAKSYAKEEKSLSECIQFILGEVRESGNCAFSDDEIYGMAIHYYDEKDLKIESSGSVKIVCPGSASIELTAKEKAAAKIAAVAAYQESLTEKMLEDAQAKRAKRKHVKEEVNQLSLF